MKSGYFIWVCTALILFASGASGVEVINIGALSDTTGATSDVSKDYALGLAEAVHYVVPERKPHICELNYSTPMGSPEF